MTNSVPLPGDIGLTSIRGPVGWLIEFGQWANGDGFGAVEHAFVVLEGQQLIEAYPGGARVRPLAEYAQQQVLYLCPPDLTWPQRWAICDAARTYEGVPYSWLDYIALATHRLRLPLPGLRRFIGSTGHMICSQLADQAYLDAGAHLFLDGRWPGYVTPMAILDLLGRPQTRPAPYRTPGAAPHSR